ncbi:MAG TPA: hypothetical protein PKK69_07775, partial [Ferruginibacter sp.]|nr:hypothetical protein [Ferruginibacter sp.]
TLLSVGTIYLLAYWQMIHSILILGTICTVVYSLPLWPLRSLQFLRQFGLAKTILLSFTWTIVLHAWPFGSIRSAFEFPYYWYFIGRFCLLLILCILFDARDVRVDRERSFRSLATDLPVYWIHAISLASVLGFGYAMHQYLRAVPVLHQYAVVMGTVIVLAVLYRMSFQQRGYYFYYFGVDGMLLLNALASFLVIT